MIQETTGRMDRRGFLRYSGVGTILGMNQLLPSYLRADLDLGRRSPDVLSGSEAPVQLTIGETRVEIAGRRARAHTINGTIPGPLLRFREGDEAEIHVTNTLDEDTSLHWHGILLPNEMDGVPGVNFPGIPPGETFVYRFPIRQYGTYWYHSHSGMQEQTGIYAPLVIDPAAGEPEASDREYVILLSDWTFEDPHRLMARLKKQPGYYNREKRTVFDFFRDAAANGLGRTISDRLEWGGMRMDPTDIADVTGATYIYLLNGRPAGEGWTGLFQSGERVRLRFINGSAASFFDVRIPELSMKVVQASGQSVKPVDVDEFRIATAETYDVIVEPEDKSYSVFAEAMDRSGFALGTLAPRQNLRAAVPARRPRPLLSMADMGMDHGAGGMVGMPGMEGMDHSTMPGMTATPAPAADTHAGHVMPAPGAADVSSALRAPGTIPEEGMHAPQRHGVGNAAVPMVLRSRLHEPGVGLGEDGRRVLVYTDLEALEELGDITPAQREIEIHLTGNMERFMWSIDGTPFSDAEPIQVSLGERIRLTMVNDTMMNHPMHLHGMWMQLENGKGTRIPRVHTVNVKPAEKLSVLFTADAPGPWAFHCHILYHMDVGMFRIVQVGSAPAAHVHPGEG